LLLGFFPQFFVVYCVWPSNADDVSQAFIYEDLEGPIQINNTDLENISNFTYLGSIVSTTGGTDEDIQARKKKALQDWLLLVFFPQFFVVYCVWPSNADDVSQAFIYKDLEGIDGGGSFSPSFGLEPTRSAKKRKAQKHLAKRSKYRATENWNDLE
jgi:hypothetical protein